MKTTLHALAFAAASGALMFTSQAQADSWTFDGNEQEISALVSQAEKARAQQNLYVEVYQNQMNCWSWDACADKARVYGIVRDSHAFN
ncbi:hypothetical protein [Thiomicrorhabdus cannonii]|uniref:hypothetical protein n=1 Tax=Thiomicrorhabdus cannonii TaxID=2748011 RepID=UPI0015B8460F|nr:hypothetical protein [Thiomicrorhabdus cannonii]